ncbi:glycosyltransferase family 4 protein [Marinomonas polaris]|uniref:glycosyltransferase family 4 protein n=1 Tax=Marinomonas polaris TaxID=293552 RepID=UPI003F9CBE7F
MILIDCRLAEKKETGISRFTIELSNRLYKKNNEIKFIVNDYHDSINGEQLVCKYKPFNLVHFILFYYWVRQLNPELYISLHYSGLYKSMRGCRSIVTVHDLMFLIVSNFFGKPIKNFLGKVYFKIIVGLSIRNAHEIFSVSKTTANDVERFFERDSFVTGEGVNFLSPTKEVSSSIKEVIEEGEYFFYIGNSRPHKCIDEFVKGFILYRKQGGKKRFLIAGSNLIYRYSGIDSLGYVSDEELYHLYKNSSAFIFPSRYEGFGLPILEALNANITIKANEIEAFKEFKSKNIDFFDVDSPQSIAECLSREEEFDSADAEKTLSKYTWDKTLDNILNHVGDLNVK